jgi:hypothetical protein
VLQITWQRLWADGKKVNEPVHGPVQLTLTPGSRVVLDYLSATPTPECPAVGMALEISLGAAATASLLQADLWLVYQQENAAAQSQRQTIRVGQDGEGKYYFNDVALDSKLHVRISGALSRVEVLDGNVSMDVTITQTPLAENVRGGSTTYPIKAKLGDTISFKLPMPHFFFFNGPGSSGADPTSLRNAELSLRIRTEQIR